MMTRERVLGPDASAAQLRHLEGQRALVAHIENMIARGRKPIIQQSRAPNHQGDTDHAKR